MNFLDRFEEQQSHCSFFEYLLLKSLDFLGHNQGQKDGNDSKDGKKLDGSHG